jgi:UDP-2,4-diacetamido-2,4,6-trideoxy-beta-L-altropyranose hydrolase
MRIAAVLSGEGFFLRPATAGDRRLLWEWANDPAVRSSSFSPSSIPWETHQAWFADKLRQEKCLILIAEDEEGSPVGQIRFDARPDGDFEIDVSVAPNRRGQGLGEVLIRRGVQTVLREKRCLGVHAFVKPENEPSLNAFAKAGFTRIGDVQIQGNAAVQLVYQLVYQGN